MADNGAASLETPVRRERTGGPALDVLRFFAAFFIVLFHAGDDAPIALAKLSPIFERGYLATDFFLMLSGFVLGIAYGPRLARGQIGFVGFMRARLTRIWPAHLVVLLAFAALVGGLEILGRHPPHTANFLWRDWFAQLALVQSWGVTGAGDGWNEPTWTLSALLVCYALFPFVWRLIAPLRSADLLIAVGLLAIGGIDAIAHALAHQDFYDLGPTRLGVLRGVPLFVLGVCIARACARRPIGLRAGVTLCATGVALFAASQAWMRLDLLSIAAIALVMRGAAGLPTRPFGPATVAGRVSFSLFITHTLVVAVWFGGLHLLGYAQPSLALGWLFWAIGLGLTLGVAVAFDQVVDQPLQAWIKRRERQGWPIRRRLAASPIA